MNRSNTHWVLLGLLCTLAVPATAQSQRMAVPSYFYPGPLWSQMAAAAPTLGLSIINPNSGPGDKPDPVYQAQVRTMQAKGVKVLCYVHTSYAKRDFATVQKEMQEAFDWYKVDGIFLDEVSYGPAELPYYLRCWTFIKAQGPNTLDVLNPGCQVDEGYMKVSDIICNFESPYASYEKYTAPAWLTRYPARRFWHIILGVPTEAEMQAVVRESKARHAGWVFATPYSDAHNGNPYDKLPPEPYWSDELTALKKTK